MGVIERIPGANPLEEVQGAVGKSLREVNERLQNGGLIGKITARMQKGVLEQLAQALGTTTEEPVNNLDSE